jgi:hypothetical protein
VNPANAIMAEAFAGSRKSGHIPASAENTRWPGNIKGASLDAGIKGWHQGSELGLTGGLRLRLGLTQWVR